MDFVVDSDSAAYATTLLVQNRLTNRYPVDTSMSPIEKEANASDSHFANTFPALAGPNFVDSEGKREWCSRHNHYYDTSVENPEGKSVNVSDFNDFAMDFCAGTVAGIASTVVGHPFDTVKVRLQSSTAYSGMVQCTTHMVRHEGVSGLFKGLSTPMATVPLVNAVVYSAYGRAKSIVLSTRQPGREKDPLSFGEGIFAGAFAGLVNTLVVTPMELVKCWLQNQAESGAKAQFKGPLDCVRHIHRHLGVAGLFRGNVAMICREVPSYMGYFGVYEFLKTRFTPLDAKGQPDPSAMSVSHQLIAGGVAGMVCWTVSYPQDVIKLNIQMQPLDKPPIYHDFAPWCRDGGFIQCGRQIAQREGWRGFWRGYTPCVLRAFPSCAAAFYFYELVADAWPSWDEEEEGEGGVCGRPVVVDRTSF